MVARNPTDEAYADRTVFTEALGDHPRARILSVCLVDHDCDLNASEISHMAGIERSTFNDHIDILLNYGLVKITSETDGNKMYTINKDSWAAKSLGEFGWRLLDTLNDEGQPDSKIDDRDN
jgi:DNA-binding transcriptional ArsR family regulator